MDMIPQEHKIRNVGQKSVNKTRGSKKHKFYMSVSLILKQYFGQKIQKVWVHSLAFIGQPMCLRSGMSVLLHKSYVLHNQFAWYRI